MLPRKASCLQPPPLPAGVIIVMSRPSIHIIAKLNNLAEPHVRHLRKRQVAHSRGKFDALVYICDSITLQMRRVAKWREQPYGIGGSLHQGVSDRLLQSLQERN